MKFEAWLDDAWEEHATDAASVALRIGDGAALATRAEDIEALGRLAHHVYGEHLARYGDGRAFLARLSDHEHGAGAALLLQVLGASLALAAGEQDPRPAADVPARVRITALAAASLVDHDASRAGTLLREALSDTRSVTLDDRDPACRAMAIAGNQIACSLEGKAARTHDERTLMTLAAQTARDYWGRAGTWLETERAEYRLAQTWRHAGDLVEARRHAQECLAIVREHGSPPLEDFFGWEALGLAEREAGNATDHAQALANAREAFERLDEADRKWCEPSLVALGGQAAAEQR